MNEVIENIKKANEYLASEYKIIKRYLEDRHLHSNNDIFAEELKLLQEKLINKIISDIEILNRFYSTYIRSKIKFDNLKTIEEKQGHMQYGQLIHYVEQLLQGNINFDWIEIDKNIVNKDNVYYLKDTEIKLFEDVEVKNHGKYYYSCNVEVALDVNNIQKLFSNEIMDLDYLSKAHYNNNKIFFFKEKQERKYSFEVDLTKYKLYKRVYFVDTGFKEIYFIKENEIDIDSFVDVDIDDKRKYTKQAYSFIKGSLIELRNQIPFIEQYQEKLKILKDYDINFENHLLTLKNAEKEFFNGYVIVKGYEGTHKVYLDNSYNRYFHGTSLTGAKNIIKNGFNTNSDVFDFDFNKLFFSPNINIAKYYGAIGGVVTNINADTRYIIFECCLDEYEEKLYHYIHTVEHFIYDNKPIKIDIIKRIWLVEDDVIIKEISKEELLSL